MAQIYNLKKNKFNKILITNRKNNHIFNALKKKNMR
jgi:hypothetical protein